MERVMGALYSAVSRHRRAIALAIYGAITVFAYLSAFMLRFEFSWRSEYAATVAVGLPTLLAIRLTFGALFKLNTRRWRFIGTRDVLRLVGATAVGSAVFYLFGQFAPLSPPIPQSVVWIEWVLSTYITAGAWLLYRTGFEHLRHRRSGYNGSAKRVLIIGAGEAGSMLAREMRRFPTGYRPIGFIDDDPDKRGTIVHGLEVLGSTSRASYVARRHRAQELIIAAPSASPSRLRVIVERCEAAGLPLKVLPGIAEVLSGDVRLNHVRDIEIEDLLGRDPIQLELPELAEDLRDRSILITGAAGSIGSELARQVALYEPATLVLLDQAETDLYYLELELRDRRPDLSIVPVVADVSDAAGVEKVFREHRPARVFHAAAYKHVPMMESNPREAIRNNVVGTWRVASAAGRYGAEQCVLVSTDKAVRPAGVMGASKRLAELVVLELQARYPDTRLGAVRFGNVLGSNGSVIPIFKRQLEQGKPLTVTHPDATRYFMTIPEAVQLVLQASLLEDLRGRIAMLEMGRPVRILDLAKNLLRLAGLGHENGRRLDFTGLRPGEKLHEELIAPGESAQPTSIPKVKLIESRCAEGSGVLRLVQDVDRTLGDPVTRILHELPELIPSLTGAPSTSQDSLAAAGHVGVR